MTTATAATGGGCATPTTATDENEADDRTRTTTATDDDEDDDENEDDDDDEIGGVDGAGGLVSRAGEGMILAQDVWRRALANGTCDMAKDQRGNAKSSEAPQATAREGRAALWYALGVCAAGALAYSNSFNCPFVFDDRMHIVDGTTVRRMLYFDDAGMFTFRPLAMMSLALNFAVGGLRPVGYHIVNLAVHLGAALALFGLLRRILRFPVLRERFGEASTFLAFAVALLWVVHPLQTGAVTYVVQRMESMMGMFYLLSLYCAVRWFEGAEPVKGFSWWAIGSVSACAAAMACKEVAASLPIMILLMDGLLVSGGFREALRRRWGFYLALAATWVLLLPAVLAGMFRPETTAGFGAGIRPAQYLATQCGVVMHYLALVVRPWPLCLDYAWPLASSVGEVLPGAVVLGGLLAATVYGVVTRRAWALLGAAFFLILTPTSSIMPIADMAFEHRMYLPLAAVLAGIVLAAYALERRWTPQPGGAAAAACLLGIATLALGGLTFRRNIVYGNEVEMWSDCIRQNPNNARAWLNRGAALGREGLYEPALKDLTEAIPRQTRGVDAYRDRGVVSVNLRRYDDAMRDFDEAIRLNPRDARALAERALVWVRKGEAKRALEDTAKALAINPRLPQAWNYRGMAAAHLRQFADAEAYCSEAIRLRSDYADAYANRAMVRDQAGALGDAVADYTRAAALGGADADLMLNRGSALAKMGRYAEAAEDFERAISLRPKGAAPRVNRGLLRQIRGDTAGALADYGAAVALDPGYAPAYANRAALYAALGERAKAREDVAKLRALGVMPPAELLKAVEEQRERRTDN